LTDPAGIPERGLPEKAGSRKASTNAWLVPAGVTLLSAAVIAGSFFYGVSRQRSERAAAGPEYVEVSEETAREVLAALSGKAPGQGVAGGQRVPAGISPVAGGPRSSAPQPQPPFFGSYPAQAAPRPVETGAVRLVNSSDFEAVARLVPEGMRAAGQYFRIPPFATVPVNGVPHGKYTVFYSTGRNWDDAVKRFLVEPAYSRSSASLPDKQSSKETSVILYHPEDPERKRSAESDFAG